MKKNLFIVGTCLIAIIVAIILRLFNYENCLIHYIFKYPCPSCGMTRAYLALFKGNVKEAFNYHPLFWMIPLIIILLLIRKLKCLSFLFKKNIIWILIIAMFFITYIIRIIISFPNPFL